MGFMFFSMYLVKFGYTAFRIFHRGISGLLILGKSTPMSIITGLCWLLGKFGMIERDTLIGWSSLSLDVKHRSGDVVVPPI